MEFYFSKPIKNVIVKHIGSYKPRDRCQADKNLLPNFMWDRFKYIFTIVDHFTKYEWVIQLNDQKTEKILTAFNNESPHIIFLIGFRLITEESSKYLLLKIFVNQKVLLESMKNLITPSKKE